MLNPLKTTLIVLAMVGMVSLLGCKEKPKAPTKRYFEYGVSFTLKSGCKSGAQATVQIDHQLSFDEIRHNTQSWIGKDSIVKFNVWYLSEITPGEMYAVRAPYNCQGKDIHIFNRLGKVRILNQKSNKY